MANDWQAKRDEVKPGDIMSGADVVKWADAIGAPVTDYARECMAASPGPAMSSGAELLPCPFCGGEAQFAFMDPDETHTELQCSNQDCPMPSVFSHGSTEEEAAKRWNTRASQPAPAPVEAPCVDCRDYEGNIRDWIEKLGGDAACTHISCELERLIDKIASQPAPAPDAERVSDELYFIQDMRSYCGNSVSWWCADGKGYTSDLSKAWRVTKEVALRMVRHRPDVDRAWRVSDILAGAQTHFDMQRLRELQQPAPPSAGKGDRRG